MERITNEPLLDTVNSELAKSLEQWHRSPYSSETAGKINTLAQLAQSAGYEITLEIDRINWEVKNAAENFPDLRYRIHENVAVVDIDPQQNKGILLYAYADHPTDEYTPSSASFTIRYGDKSVEFLPQGILSIQITKERTFNPLKEVKDTYWPNVSDDEFLKIIDSGAVSETLIEIINRTTRGKSSQ